MDELISQTSEITFMDYEDFVRPPRPDEPTTKGQRQTRYCTFDDCIYASGVVSNIRRHIESKNQVYTTISTSAVQGHGTEEIQDL